MTIRFDEVVGAVDPPSEQGAEASEGDAPSPRLAVPHDEQLRRELRLLFERACRLHAD